MRQRASRPFVPLLLLLGALALAGCTPRLIPAGPAVSLPRDAGEALVMPDGARLPLHAWLPDGAPRGVLLGLHGFNDSARNFMAESAALFTAQGIAVYAYDQRGFGAAPHPGESLAADATDAATLLRARHPGLPLWMLGESMGAAVLIQAASGPSPPPADGFLFSAPALWGRATMNGPTRWGLWLASRTIPIVGFYGNAGGIVASDNDSALRRWGNDPLTLKTTRVDAAKGLVDLMDDAVAALPFCCHAAGREGPVPTLVMLGARDEVVPRRAARLALTRLRAAHERLALYPQGYHLLLRDRNREVVAQDILAWMSNPAAPLPSGAEAGGRAWLTERGE
jgi:acylglycerol lipase